MIEPFKIKVEDEKHSKEIQQYLFERRVPWYGGGTSVVNIDKPFLFVYQASPPCDFFIAYVEEEKLFNCKSLPEKWFYNGKLQDKPMNNTKTYREVAEALLKGIELQSLDSGRWIPITYLGIDVRYLDSQYPRKVRVKPRTCNGVELDPCLEPEQLKKGIYYYYPDPMHVDYYGSKLWDDDGDDHYWFELGFVYATRESAAKHGQAMGRYM